MSETSIANTGGSGNLSTSLSYVARLRHTQNLCGFQRQLRWDNHYNNPVLFLQDQPVQSHFKLFTFTYFKKYIFLFLIISLFLKYKCLLPYSFN
jgi:hypothetical protein